MLVLYIYIYNLFFVFSFIVSNLTKVVVVYVCTYISISVFLFRKEGMLFLVAESCFWSTLQLSIWNRIWILQVSTIKTLKNMIVVISLEINVNQKFLWRILLYHTYFNVKSLAKKCFVFPPDPLPPSHHRLRSEARIWPWIQSEARLQGWCDQE